jgi:hypothetical protein
LVSYRSTLTRFQHPTAQEIGVDTIGQKWLGLFEQIYPDG